YMKLSWVYKNDTLDLATMNMELGAIGYVLDLEEFKSRLDDEFASSEARILDAINKIEAIGEVTKDSGPIVAQARAAYDALDAGMISGPVLQHTGTPEKSLVGTDRLALLLAAEEELHDILTP